MLKLRWIKPITDRTSDDVEIVNYLNRKLREGTLTPAEKAVWLTDLKGAFNLSDQRRILNNLNILNKALELNLTIPSSDNLPNSDWYALLIHDIKKLKDSYIVYDNTPDVPENPLNYYKKFNDIEKILEDIYLILSNNFFHYCGESYYSGDEFGLLL